MRGNSLIKSGAYPQDRNQNLCLSDENDLKLASILSERFAVRIPLIPQKYELLIERLKVSRLARFSDCEDIQRK